MIRNGLFECNDIYLDFSVCGNLLSRPGLDALRARLVSDPSVNHILIPRRDRLSRPDDPTDGLLIELGLRRSGFTLVFMDRILSPIARGERVDIGDLITGVVDYDRAGKDRRELAQKLINAQLALIKAGFSTGGRPQYGFRRWLVRMDGTAVRELMEGERVRMAGHHVAWLPVAEDHPHMCVIMRIREMLKSIPASRVARILTEERVPPPDFGRTRKDNGIVHVTSGIWNQSTVTNIGRSELLAAVCSYGQRSMGDQLRFSPEGPRQLEDHDYHGTSRKPKVIRNAPTQVQRHDAHFKPLVDPAEHYALQRVLDSRGASQRGKPRSRTPGMNPLGGRQFDMECGWPMYRTPYGKGFRYLCGFYAQSQGQQCNHNLVDGPTATRFALSCVRQKILRGGLLGKVKERLHELAIASQSPSSTDSANKCQELKQVQANIMVAKRNMALAESAVQRTAMAEVFEDLLREEASLRNQIVAADKSWSGNPNAEVEAALSVFNRLEDLVADEANLAAIGEALVQ